MFFAVSNNYSISRDVNSMHASAGNGRAAERTERLVKNDHKVYEENDDGGSDGLNIFNAKARGQRNDDHGNS
ncbi:hypothetical protein AKJ24_02905 [Corynebacterium glutamicum]|nr:hypothetical protein AKJ20_00860 [Corynebacterium glutamicum]TWS44982.1 hypothetical protein AKJ24_02905 [Corynebacterium glutamicum]